MLVEVDEVGDPPAAVVAVPGHATIRELRRGEFVTHPAAALVVTPQTMQLVHHVTSCLCLADDTSSLTSREAACCGRHRVSQSDPARSSRHWSWPCVLWHHRRHQWRW